VVEVSLYPFLNLNARWREWSTSRTGRLFPVRDIRYPLNERLAGPRGASVRVRKTSFFIGFRNLNFPAT